MMTSIKFEDYKTDKGPEGHSYQRAYDRFCFEKRDQVKNVIEIGTRPGSINLWLDYFPNCTLFGWDLKNPKVNNPRFVYRKVNQSSDQEMREFFQKEDREFDVIIDDGPHTPKEQTRCLEIAFPYLKSGGVYIVEDLHCTDPNNEPQKSYLQFMNGADYNFRDIISRLESSNFEPTMYLHHPKELYSQIRSIHVEYGDNVRWRKLQKTPSDIVFIIKK